MYEFRLEKPERLKERQRLAYESFARNKAETLILQGKHVLSRQANEFLFLGAYHQRELVGCLAFSVLNVLWTADLQFIYVKPEYQRQGIAFSLFQELKAVLIKKKILVCWFRYTEENVDKQAVEGLLLKAQWKAPYCQIQRSTFDSRTTDFPWLHRDYFLSEELELFPWHQLSDEERHVLKKQVNQGSIPEFFSPFWNKYALEPLNSFGIRYQQEVVAWLITRRLDRETILYSTLFVQPDARFKGCALALLTQAIHLQKDSSIRWAVCEINFKVIKPSLRRFFKTYLIPFAHHIEHQMVSSLNLNAS